ncbi:WD40 repeat-containing protein [Tanacetum coccineum]
MHHHHPIPYPTPPNPNPNSTALLTTPSTDTTTSPPLHFTNSGPTGRCLSGGVVVYDVDVRLGVEMQPQLEATPITKYGSDPVLVLGRQIAVSKSYICYGLKQGAVRVINKNTGLRALFKGFAQRVTDMAFFAEDVYLLASASMDGRVYVWKITEGLDDDDTPQIIGNIVFAVEIVGEGEFVHPRICWHCHKQEVLVVGIGRRVLKIDTTKLGRGEVYSAEEPLICHVDKLINGIQFVGNHDGEVTDLSMCQWMITRLVSASVDGTIKIWEDRKSSPIAVLRPHDGLPVNSAMFLTAPHRPDHIILITGGPFNREVKIWASESEEGWLLPSDVESWHCTQTLELKSSAEPRVEDSFFNQVVVLSQPGVLLLANAKKNAIYAVHLEYGPNPEMTRMDYISEFTVTMPILSLTCTSALLPHSEIIQVYCVQTQAIQQYALDSSRCLPPPIDSDYEKLDLGFLHDTVVTESVTSSVTNDADISSIFSPSVPICSKLSQKLPRFITPAGGTESNNPPSDHGDKKVVEYAVDRQIATALSNLSNLSNQSNLSSFDDDFKNDESKVAKDDSSMVKFKHPTHLVTPADLMAISSSEPTRIRDPDLLDTVANPNQHNKGMDVKIVGVTGTTQKVDFEPQSSTSEHKEKSFSPQVSDLGFVQARDRSETYFVDGTEESKTMVQILNAQDEFRDVRNDLLEPTRVKSPTPITKEKKYKGKNAQGSGPSSPSLNGFNSIDSSIEPGVVSSTPSAEVILSHLQSMQETITQVLINQKEILKQIPVLLTVPLTKEGRRIEAAIAKSMEKAYKANTDAQWARTREEFSKQEKSNRDRNQQVSSLVTNGYKELLATWEKMLKRETTALVSSVVRSITPIIEKAVSNAILEAIQRGVADKAVSQLEKSVRSKLEAIVARQIQAQFQTSVKQTLQEALRSSMKGSIIPAFETSCKAMFDQVDATFKKGLLEHTSTALQQVESTHSPLAVALRDAINSASSMTRTLSSEVADGQRKLVALAVAGANSKTGGSLMTQLSNGSIDGFREKIEAPVDPTKELSRLVYEHKYEEAFTYALQRSDVWIVSWLCSRVDIQGILTSNPLPLSQGVLLSLLQQLACDISNDTSRKLSWMMDTVVAIKPSDGMIAMHVRPIFDQVYSILNHQVSLPTTSVSELSHIRVLMKLINSTIRGL